MVDFGNAELPGKLVRCLFGFSGIFPPISSCCHMNGALINIWLLNYSWPAFYIMLSLFHSIWTLGMEDIDKAAEMMQRIEG